MDSTIKHTAGFLVHLRECDSSTGVSEQTVAKLMEATGLSKSEVVHLALKEMAARYLPAYEKDDGVLTSDQLRSIREASTATNTPDESFTERLF